MNIKLKQEILSDLKKIENIENFLGLSANDFIGHSEEEKKHLIVGEYVAFLIKQLGEIAVNELNESHHTTDWYDHRFHFFRPDFADWWAISADNILLNLPIDGTLLNLCSGDGWYDYMFYRHRAKLVTCVEISARQHQQAMRLHSANNIKHVCCDVLKYEYPEKFYDVVMIRGAIEHFSEENQQVIFKNALKSLKPNGWFCGDTVAANESGVKQLEEHECEWENENEMYVSLSKVFKTVIVNKLVSKGRTTLFWQAQ